MVGEMGKSLHQKRVVAQAMQQERRLLYLDFIKLFLKNQDFSVVSDDNN